ncbi:MAG: outer membrane lipoprotein-sorting protein [Crocinitomicaceae bacterium]|nr:outer membrane lipoprotein-sorting protein [Crocinitomicaceae bacterium]|tara:strand:+ start:4915 stop:5667 length:753 start_codon:yes stop_codon:yes gene_type:complete
MKTAAVLTTLLIIGFYSATGQDLTAKQIVEKANNLTLGKSAKGEMEMTIQRPSWSRTITMKSWSLGREFSMIYITGPARDKGQVFLKRKTEMWNWMPTVSRMMKIPSSMMGQSWMGSDFTNDDLVRMNSIVEDYNHKIVGEETIGGYPCYKVELIPKEDAAVVWGKLEMWIAKGEWYTLKQTSYDEDMILVNTMTASDIKQMGNRKLPARMELIPADKENQKTIFVTKWQEFDIDIDETFFSQQNMKRVR